MYFFAIEKNVFTDKPYIPCGMNGFVDVDGRYSLTNQFTIAHDNLKRNGLVKNYIGIACFRTLRDQRPFASIKADKSAISFESLNAFDHSELF